MPVYRYVVDVGWTSVRPVIPEQHYSRITVMADTGHEAALVAVHMAAARPFCEMPTSSTVISWEEGAP